MALDLSFKIPKAVSCMGPVVCPSNVIRRYRGILLVQKLFRVLLDISEDKKNAEMVSAWGSNLGLVKDECDAELEMLKKNDVIVPEWQVPEVGRVITIESVEPLPPMLYWERTAKNVMTPDSTYLTNLPQLSKSEVRTRKEEVAFMEQLKNLYDGKMEVEEERFLHERYPQVFRKLFIGLSVLEAEFGVEVFSSKAKIGEESRAPTEQDLRSLAKVLSEGVIKELTNGRISDVAFVTVHDAPLYTGEKDDLRKWYMAEFHPTKLDAKAEKVKAMLVDPADIYRKIFCRICFTYACIRHRGVTGSSEYDNLATALPEHYINNAAEARKREGKKWTFSCSQENCTMKKGEVKTIEDSYNTKWTYRETSLCRSMFKVYGDPCFVSWLLKSKTCSEVMMYATKYKLSVEASSNCNDNPQSGNETTDSSTYNAHKSPLPTSDIIIPCSHNGPCGKDCSCVKRNVRCEKCCGCAKSCKYRYTGCKCSGTCDTTRCPCFLGLRECDPDLCFGCGAHQLDNAKVTCQNVKMQRGLGHQLLLGRSTVSGWGVFAKKDIKKGEFVSEYVGELISNNEADRRGFIYDKKQHTFLFSLDDGFTVDATRLGNRIRFMNSSKRPNCVGRRMLVNGERRIGLYAKRNIAKGDELFFDYQDVVAAQRIKNRRQKPA